MTRGGRLSLVPRVLLGGLGLGLGLWGVYSWVVLVQLAYLRYTQSVILDTSETSWFWLSFGLLSPLLSAYLFLWVRKGARTDGHVA